MSQFHDIRTAFEFLGRLAPPRPKIVATFEPRGDAPLVTTWTYDRRRHGDEIRIVFSSRKQMRRFAPRWRVLAQAIWECGREDEGFRCENVRIHLGDGVTADGPQDVVAFARRRGSAVRLIPNIYLLGPRPGLPAPRPWEDKTDTLYFRGASTGSPEYAANTRVVFCQVARSITGADCRISKLRQIDRDFVRRLAADGLVAGQDRFTRLNDHRFLADVDGNTSSWDRYFLIGMFGGVPIRFEPAWEEDWHESLRDGENFVHADRHTLADVLAWLRRDEQAARRIAARAADVARTILSPAALRCRLRSVIGSGA